MNIDKALEVLEERKVVEQHAAKSYTDMPEYDCEIIAHENRARFYETVAEVVKSNQRVLEKWNENQHSCHEPDYYLMKCMETMTGNLVRAVEGLG